MATAFIWILIWFLSLVGLGRGVYQLFKRTETWEETPEYYLLGLVAASFVGSIYHLFEPLDV